MKTYVMDASVAAKWFFREENSEKADRLAEKFQSGNVKLVVPELFYSEMGNICWKKIKQKECNLGEATEKLQQVLRLPLERRDDKEFLDVALESSVIYKISIYDSLYMSLAEAYLCSFLTADKVLYDVCHKRFDFIELLSNYNPEH